MISKVTSQPISSKLLIPSVLVNVSGPFSPQHIPPSWSFSIGFSRATFLPSPGSSEEFSFSVQLDNGDLIPHWLVFAITSGGVVLP